MNRIELQNLIVDLAGVWNVFQTIAVKKLLEQEDPLLAAYYADCLFLADEWKNNPRRYDTVGKALYAVYALQRPEEKVRKKDYMAKMGIKYNKGLRQIECGERELKAEEISALCADFPDAADSRFGEVHSRFWENYIFTFAPENRFADAEAESIEYRCMHAIWVNLDRMPDPSALRKLQEERTAEYERLDRYFRCSGAQEFAPATLYSVIDAEKAAVGLSYDTLLQADMLGIDPKTWYEYKRNWIAAEKKGFQNGFPKNHISHVDLLILAVLLDCSYKKSVQLLSLAGSAFLNRRPDPQAAAFLRKGSAEREEDRDKILQLLRGSK